MNTVRKGLLAATAVAAFCAGACDDTPTAASRGQSVRGAPTAPPPSTVRRQGNVVLAVGADADTMIRHTAARWVLAGTRSLQQYVDTSTVWDGKPPIAPTPPRRDAAGGPSDLSGLVAEVTKVETLPSVNGSHRLATATSGYVGTDAHTDLRFGANISSTGVADVPPQTAGYDDGHAIQKLECGAEIIAGATPAPDSVLWTGTVAAAAGMSLAHSCGEAVYSSATTRAWYELPVPIPSVNTHGAGAAFSWMHFGDSSPLAVGERTASQPDCPKQVVPVPSCGNQIIPDPAACNPDGSNPMTIPGIDGTQQHCSYVMMLYEESYDHGVTWVVVNRQLLQFC